MLKVICNNLVLRSGNFFTRKFCSAGIPKKICIVGSGPAGFYTAQYIIKNDPSLEVDVYEKLPVPFGLVRYGVAPDHPDVKNVINTFTAVAKSGRLNFIGNVSVGEDVTLKELRGAYDAVVLAYGAAQDRWLGIPGENLRNVISARNFVGWYNGHPEDRNLEFDLNVETAAIIGQGNVALDIARILLTPVDILKKTDITQQALEALSCSKIKNVKIIGRRGPLQVAFTIKELREMVNLPESSSQISIDDVDLITKLLSKASRPRKRITELLLKAMGNNHQNNLKEAKHWELLFKRTPLEIVANPTTHSVSGINVQINRLTGEDFENPIVEDSGVRESIPCGIIFKSIGYKSLPLAEELPFNHAKGVILQKEGRVDGLPGVFCSGWVASGPVGVIATTLQSGHAVGRNVLKDLQNELSGGQPKRGKDSILPLLSSKGIKPVTFIDWEALDQEERQRGKHQHKPREKVTDVREMLDIIHKRPVS